ELVLDLLRRDVLPAGGDEDVLLAVGDPEVAHRVELPYVPGMEPAARQRLGARLRVLVVAEEVAGAAREDLAVLGDPHVDAPERGAHRAQAYLARAQGDEAGRLGEAVTLAHVDAEAPEVGEDLWRDGCGARYRQSVV